MIPTPASKTMPDTTVSVGRQHDPRRSDLINVGRLERILSLLTGGGLALYGLLRFDLRGLAVALFGGELIRRGATGHDYLYRFLDVNSNAESPRSITGWPNHKGITVRRSVTIERSPDLLYQFWRDVEKAPLYMPLVESVTITGVRTSHWVAKLPTGHTIEWDSEITEDIPGEYISWKATSGIPLAGTAGRIRFTSAPGKSGTIVTVETDYSQLGGPLGVELGKLFGHMPEHQIRESLRQFKQIMEAGETPTIAGQPVGKGQMLSQQGIKKNLPR